MTRSEILAKLTQVQVDMITASRQFTGRKELFDAACFSAHGQDADEHRGVLHALLDQQLDLSAQAMTLSRALTQLQG